MALKNITLTGAEITVTGLDGSNAAIRNDGADVIYAAKQPGITPGAEGVLLIPAGGSAVLYGISREIFALGTGAATIISSDYKDNPFKSAAQGGSGADDAIRAAIKEHEDNGDIHLTAKKAQEAAAKVFSNPNLLINPDFRINQRGASGVISTAGYFIDRWQLVSGTAEITANGIVLNGTMKQILENAAGTNVTASASAGTASYDDAAKTFTLTATGETIEWAKLETGGVATPFVPPDPATELLKCQRFFLRSNRCFEAKNCYFVPISCMVEIMLPTTMRAAPNLSVFSIKGTPNTLSYWHNSEDVAKLNDIVLLFASAHECTCLRSPGGKFTADDGKLCFYYTADAEIY